MAEGVADPSLPPALAEALEARRVVRGGTPHARALREELHGVAADRLDPVDRRVDPTRARNVSADQHGATLSVSPGRAARAG